MSLLTAKSALINEIFLTGEFNALRQAQRALELNKDNLNSVRQYQAQLAIYKEKLMNGIVSEEQEKILKGELNRLMSTAQTANYIRACKNMGDMVDRICDDINRAIDGMLL
jgi:cell fate (sporulation/competence/biofilm development) regulator YlbF (YheA/YmcA/DUF963 family)